MKYKFKQNTKNIKTWMFKKIILKSIMFLDIFFTLNLIYEQSLKNKIEHPVVQYVWYMYIFNFNLI